MYYIEGKNGSRFVGFFGGVSVWSKSGEVDPKDYIAYQSAEYDVARLVKMGYACHIRTGEVAVEAHAT